jgi:hypothetical protein
VWLPACSASPGSNASARASKRTNPAKQGGSAKSAKGSQGGKGGKQAVLTQTGAPQLTAEQIVANSDANIERIKNRIESDARAGEALDRLQQRDALSRP